MGDCEGATPSLVAVDDLGSAEGHDHTSSRGGISMRKKVFSLGIVFAAVVGICAVLAATPAAAKSCPKNSHLIQCPTYSFCCPNNAFCVCL
jgi:hypothetical protein